MMCGRRSECEVLDGLLAKVRFRHPLVRSAAYRSTPLAERQDVHWALADVSSRRQLREALPDLGHVALPA